MNKETKQCQNCKQEFTIEPDDFAFYEKISVPAPTFCWECRLIRRMNFRNLRALYKRTCDATNKQIISVYAPDKPFTVYDQSYWWSDGWDPLEYGREYDFSRPFLEQLRELLNITPLPSMSNTNPVNSDYCSHGFDLKDCYLTASSVYSEKILYGTRVSYSRDSVDLYQSDKMELSYESVICTESYRLFFSQLSNNCNNSAFLYNCSGCSNCLGCVNLRNKQYHIFNKPYTKNAYEEELKRLDLGSHRNLMTFREKFQKLRVGYPVKYANALQTYNVSGDNVHKARNGLYCFDGLEFENLRYGSWFGYGLKDSYDILAAGINSELIYECVGVGKSQNTKFCLVSTNNQDIQYSIICYNSSHLFGCISLRNKKYCILNKQYTKEEYEKLVPRIIKHMNTTPYTDKKGRIYKYGEFFPPELSLFNYNETIAQEYSPLTKEEAEEKGYGWRAPETKDYKITKYPGDLPDHIRDVDESILKEVIGCAHAPAEALAKEGEGKAAVAKELWRPQCSEQCTTAFRIVLPELQFYRRMNIPLPRLCPNCRHYRRLKQRNPLKLWHRRCVCGGEKSDDSVYANTVTHFHGKDYCPNEFETSYAPERKEIVYCEACYNAEIA